MTSLVSPLNLAEKKQQFENVCAAIFSAAKTGAILSLDLRGEQSVFVRYNTSKIRQIGEVVDFVLTISYFENGRFLQRTLALPNVADVPQLMREIETEAASLPPDPYAVPPSATGKSEVVPKFAKSAIPPHLDEIAKIIANVPLTGILAAGPIVRAAANSAGARHWFETQRISFDYSLTTPDNRMVTACFSSETWDADAFAAHVQASKQSLTVLEKPAVTVKPGKYKVYLAPAAMQAIFELMSYDAFSLAKIKQGQGALEKLMRGEKTFHPHFEIFEDFRPGRVPAFNTEGEVAPEQIALVKGGRYAGSLTSARTASEYGAISNAASIEESPRALRVSGGELDPNSAHAQLDTGLYLSNLHYLNWSDRLSARITGMTRFACVWVENGKAVGPLQKDLRFDVSLYDIFNTGLRGLTREPVFLPSVLTYGGRECGGVTVPGALIENFAFTL